MTTATQIHFVRHGAVHNPQKLYYGRLPGFPLSDKGRRQAQAAAEALRHRPLAAMFSSPQQRAMETAEIIASHHGLKVRTSTLLNEIYTPHQGRPESKMAQLNWDVYAGNEPPYESPTDVLRRIQQFIAEVRDKHAGRDTIAVTHGDPIAFLVLWTRGRPWTAEDRFPLYRDWLATGAIATLVYKTENKDKVPTVECSRPHEIRPPSGMQAGEPWGRSMCGG